jgi:hypothetical protein
VKFSKENTLHKETLELKSNMDIVEEVIKKVLEQDLRIQFGFSDKKEKEAGVSAQAKEKQASQNSTQVDPVIISAMDKLQGKIVGQYYLKEDE